MTGGRIAWTGALAAAIACGAARAADRPLSDEAKAKIAAAVPARPRVKPERPRRVLVFTLTRGFRHASIPAAVEALREMGRRTGAYAATASEDIAAFEADALRRYDAVVFANPTGELFTPPGFDAMSPEAKRKAEAKRDRLRESLLAFVRSGGGFVGLHSATDCFYSWPEFGDLIGGYFDGHPWHERVGVRLDDPDHALCRAFGGKDFEITDEIYQFKAPYSRDLLRVLFSLDRTVTPHKGARPDDDYALSWVREEGKGRVFYCALGHRDEIYWNPTMLEFFLDGIQYAAGDLKGAAAEPSGAKGPPDRWMGEYEGSWSAASGASKAASARVIPEGGGRYRVVLDLDGRRVEVGGRANGKRVEASAVAMEGYLVNWEAAGPFRLAGRDAAALFEIGFPPENPRERNVTWKRVRRKDPERPWLVDLTRIMSGEDCVAYLRAEFKSRDGGKADLLIGSDDGVKAWLNGRLVHANDVMRGLEPGQDRVTVELEEGRNTLLLKITQGRGGWAACAAVQPKFGDPIKGAWSEGGSERERWELLVEDGRLTGRDARGTVELKRVDRRSPTEGLKPPKGATVLLARGGGPPSLAAWTNGTWKAMPDGSMRVGRGDNRTRKSFGDQRLHLEFRLPYEPAGRGQGRGNSGVYLQDRYEVQILDSFGLELKPGDCGAIYGVAVPGTNASLPPGVWQTYDIEFLAPRIGDGGRVTAPARATVRLNGIVIHEDVEIPGPTGGGAPGAVKEGPLRLQDHGHPVRFRNVWVAPLAPPVRDP